MKKSDYRRILKSLKLKHGKGEVKSKTDSIIHFANLINAPMTPEEIQLVRRLVNKVERMNAKVKKIRLQAVKERVLLEEAFDAKPVKSLSELTEEAVKLISKSEKSWRNVIEPKEVTKLVDERKRLAKEIKEKKKLLTQYDYLIDKYNEFSEWAQSQPNI